jgi:hypothetical protein
MNLVSIIHKVDQGGVSHNFHYKGNAMMKILESVEREGDYTFVFEKEHDGTFQQKTLEEVWGRRIRVGESSVKVGN